MEKLLHLFNTLWFEPLNTPERTPSFDSVAANETVSDSDRGLKRLISHVRSSSDQQLHVLNLNTDINVLFSDAESPKSVLGSRPKLQTLVSGKEFGDEKVVKEVKEVVGRGRRMRRRRRRRCKSLTEMEFEEVKGFMDLGFVFSEEDRKDSSLVSMIPGLGKVDCGKREGNGVCMKCGRRCGRKEKVELRVGNGGEMDELEMKNQIKFWAHSVASAVR